MKILLIINKKSGSRDHLKNIRRVKKYFIRNGIAVVVTFTEYAGHGKIIAADAVNKGYDVVVGCGGDGTINEVVNGLAGSDVKMGIIPWGTGNVFAREMKFPRKLKRLCKIIKKGMSVKIDLGVCNNSYFLLMFSSGFDAYSLKAIENSYLKKHIGIFAYVIGAAKAMINYDFPEMEIELENGQIEKGTFILISNTSYYGRYFRLTPHAKPFDGILDVVIFKERGRLNFIKLLLQIFWNSITGSHKDNHQIFMKGNGVYRVKSLKINIHEKDLVSQIDGDYFSAETLDIKVAESSLNIILPQAVVKKVNKMRRSQ